MGLLQLPIIPTLAGDTVRDTYVSELRSVTTPNQLQEFVKRWEAVYHLKRVKLDFDKKAKDAKKYRLTEMKFQNLINGKVDFWKAMRCIQMNREGSCPHMALYTCEGGHILLPVQLIIADLVGQKYGVGSDLALIQANGGLAVLYEAGRDPVDEVSHEPEEVPKTA